jgi:short-subunit dehydrogenase
LSLKPEVNDFVKFINAKRSHIQVLVNNTGVFIPGEISNEPDGHLETMINTNLYSAYYLTRGVLPMMMHDKDGHIFNICSIASIMPYANGGSYSISKYAMLGMTKVLREEMKPHGIRVTAVLPGATYTASWEGAGLPESRFMKAEDVADAVYGAFTLSPNSVVEEILIRPQEGDI